MVTPYENQVRLIFMRLRELIETSPLLKSEVDRMTQNPFQIIWKNGSAVLGFTTGAASGSGGASIRGQKADFIFMDEVDRNGHVVHYKSGELRGRHTIRSQAKLGA